MENSSFILSPACQSAGNFDLFAGVIGVHFCPPEQKECSVFEVFEAERTSVVTYAGSLDGIRCVTAGASKTCLVTFDNNKYSVMAKTVGLPVDIYACADCIIIKQDGEFVGEHERCFTKAETIYDPWHFVPVLAKKPDAQRGSAPFKNWVLPGSLGRVRSRLAGTDDSDRQIVKILTAVLSASVHERAAKSDCIPLLVRHADISSSILHHLPSSTGGHRKRTSMTFPCVQPSIAGANKEAALCKSLSAEC